MSFFKKNNIQNIRLIFAIVYIQGMTAGALAFTWQTDNSPLSYYRNYSNPGLISSQSANPANIYETQTKDNSYYAIFLDGENGDLKRIFDPKGKDDQSYTTGGSKHFGQRNLFSGSFTYHRQTFYDKMWTHNSNPYTTLPFLFADSSTGDFRLNGLYWEVTYAREWISQKIYGGTTMFYNVDEEYKTVFPKPQVNHRDIMLTHGFEIKPAKQIALGLTAIYFDFQENMETSQYNQDQTKTPIFYKIRGLDNPLVFKGETSEERLMATQGFQVKTDGKIGLLHQFDLSWIGGFEKSQCQNTDGGSYPEAQGKWYSQSKFFETNLKWNIQPAFSLSLFANGLRRNLNANHPDIAIQIYSARSQDVAVGLNPAFNFKMGTAGLKYSYVSRTYRQTDNYNGILHYYPDNINRLELNLATNIYGKITTGLDLGYDQLTTNEAKYYQERTDWFYNIISAADAAYYDCNKNLLWSQIHFSFNSPKNRQYSIYLKYSNLFSDDSDRSFLTIRLQSTTY